MITAIIASSAMISLFFLVDAGFKQKKNFVWYFVVFLLLLLMNMMYPHRSYANEYRVIPRYLTHLQKIDYMKLRDDSKANAERTYKDAKDRCWWIPDVDDRKAARHCFEIAYSSLNPGTPQSKLVTMVLIGLGEYVWYCWDEWEYIEMKLKWSKYHWEMYEFYCEVLEKG